MRVLIYSHDSFGLGHLRRCRAIAHALVEKYPELSVLILSGSPIIGSFNFRSRVDFVRIPGVIKLRDGDYTSLALHIDISETLALRESIIRHTAEIFKPHFFLVDKEPLGLRGEVKSTLDMLKQKNVPLILGIRDVMDDPALLIPEWERKEAIPALENYYDQIWVYGLPELHDPLEGFQNIDHIRNKMYYTGYLKREIEFLNSIPEREPFFEKPFILVTPGGGGDGDYLIDMVLQAYESDTPPIHPALIILGPFMQVEMRKQFEKRAESLPNVKIITFKPQIESIVNEAAGVVAMGGYNTFCELLSFDKPSLLVPRKIPRREQFLRAQKASQQNLVSFIDPDEFQVSEFIEKLNQLPHQAKPSQANIPYLLSGLDRICDLSEPLIHNVQKKASL